MLTNNERMNQIIYMFSYAAGISKEEAWEYIKKTATGRAIEDNNAVIIYEQQTGNLYEIIEELKQLNCCPEITQRLTIEKIIDSMSAMDKYEEDKRSEIELKFFAIREKDKRDRRSQVNKEKRRYQLKQRNRNKENERRWNHVDTSS